MTAKLKEKLGRTPGASRSRSKDAPPREGLEARVHGAFDYAAIDDFEKYIRARPSLIPSLGHGALPSATRQP